MLNSWHNLRISSGTADSYYDGRWSFHHIATKRSVTLAAGFRQCHADDEILPETRQVPLPPVHCSIYGSRTVLSLDTIKPRLFWLLYKQITTSKLIILLHWTISSITFLRFVRQFLETVCAKRRFALLGLSFLLSARNKLVHTRWMFVKYFFGDFYLNL